MRVGLPVKVFRKETSGVAKYTSVIASESDRERDKKRGRERKRERERDSERERVFGARFRPSRGWRGLLGGHPSTRRAKHQPPDRTVII